MTHPILDLLRLAAETARSPEGKEIINCIELNLTNHKDPSYQANVKFSNRSLVWGTYVSEDPVEALTTALDIALRGEEARKAESTAQHHEKRETANELMDGLVEEYGQNILAAKVELVPYKGWVVVLFPKPGSNFPELKNLVEMRNLPAGGTRPAKDPAGARPTRTPSAPVAPKAIGPAPEGGRASLTKDKLEAEYKAIYGKGPDRNIKKLDLAKMLDDLEAASKGPASVTLASPAEDLVPGVIEQEVDGIAEESDEDLL